MLKKPPELRVLGAPYQEVRAESICFCFFLSTFSVAFSTFSGFSFLEGFSGFSPFSFFLDCVGGDPDPDPSSGEGVTTEGAIMSKWLETSSDFRRFLVMGFAVVIAFFKEGLGGFGDTEPSLEGAGFGFDLPTVIVCASSLPNNRERASFLTCVMILLSRTLK